MNRPTAHLKIERVSLRNQVAGIEDDTNGEEAWQRSRIDAAKLLDGKEKPSSTPYHMSTQVSPFDAEAEVDDVEVAS